MFGPKSTTTLARYANGDAASAASSRLERFLRRRFDVTLLHDKSIEAEAKERIETVGREGGLAIAPAYDLEPKVKWENVLALVKAVRKEA